MRREGHEGGLLEEVLVIEQISQAFWSTAAIGVARIYVPLHYGLRQSAVSRLNPEREATRRLLKSNIHFTASSHTWSILRTTLVTQSSSKWLHYAAWVSSLFPRIYLNMSHVVCLPTSHEGFL